jgi:hypothetical protein
VAQRAPYRPRGCHRVTRWLAFAASTAWWAHAKAAASSLLSGLVTVWSVIRYVSRRPQPPVLAIWLQPETQPALSAVPDRHDRHEPNGTEPADCRGGGQLESFPAMTERIETAVRR